MTVQKTTLEQWRMFKAVAEHGGFNQAALSVHKSQSSIHHAVRKLEDALGTPLFEIHGRKAVLTRHGDLLLRRGLYLLEEVERIESVANVLGSGVEAELCIAVDEAFPQQLIYQVMEQVSAIYPMLKVELVETVLAGANEALQQGRATLALSSIPMVQGLNEEICQINFVAVANPRHALHALDRAITLEDLKSFRQIVVRDSGIHRSIDSGWLGSEQRWTVSHVRTSIDLVKQGLGFAWLPQPSISMLLESGDLKELNVERGQRRRATFYLNYRDADSLGPAAREFMGQLRIMSPEL